MSVSRVASTLARASTLSVLLCTASWAQSPGDQFTRDQNLAARGERIKALARQTPDTQRGSPPTQSRVKAGPCFPVNEVLVEGMSLVPQSAVAAITRPYSGSCVGSDEINLLLRKLTELYLDRGYITSRIYVPEQDIGGSRVLKLRAVEGVFSDIYLNGKPAPGSGELRTAFPGLRGRPANIRDVEQGLDQINRLASSKAKTTMLPGADVGTSILDVGIEHGFPWQVSLGNNNLGQKQTGTSKSAVSLRQENLLELNDLLSLTYEHSGPDYPGDSDGWGESDSYSGTFSVPYGYWTLSANGAWYEYTSEVPGNFSTLETSGTSGQLGIAADRVIHRGQDSLTQVHLALTYKETDNFLLGNRIEVGSRQYSVGSIGLTHSRRMFGGLWTFDVGLDQGLDLFGAVDKGDPSAGDADPHFTKLTGALSVSTPFDLGDQHLVVSSIANAQLSPDNLFGAEQISLGSYSNVRGTRESLLYGNNGFFVRNDIAWRTMPWADSPKMVELLGELRPYLGLDHGRIFSQSSYGIEGGYLTSWTAGTRLSGGKVNFDLGYSDVLATNASDPDGGLFFFNASLNF